MKKKLITVMLILLLLIGLSLMLYPSLSNWWNSVHQSKVIMGYLNSIESLSDEDCEKALAEAQVYNRRLLSNTNRYQPTEDEESEYLQLLNVSGNGVMGIIEIPKIGVNLPIYHKTENDILQFAAGHLMGTSLPVGGNGTHCVISGHRGLPSAKLFTDLDKLQVGDQFYVYVLNETLVYEVDQILTVEPTNLEALEIEEDKDYFTLVTCTPYSINTHRLLVRGRRISPAAEEIEYHFSAEAMRIEASIVAPFVAIPFLVLLLVLLLIEGMIRKRSRKRRNKHKSTV